MTEYSKIWKNKEHQNIELLSASFKKFSFSKHWHDEFAIGVIETGLEVKAKIENHGILSSRKGVNFPNTVIDIDVITKKDEKDIAWGVENEVDYFAISFVQNAKDMRKARNLLNGYKGKLIAKIEKFDAVKI